jgi:hypothetical protein
MPCLGTRGAPFVSRLVIEPEPIPGKSIVTKEVKDLYQSISASDLPQYRGFSFEELRLADYIWMGKLQPQQNAEPKATRAKNTTSTTSTSFIENAGMDTEQKAMTMTNASCCQNAMLKKSVDSISRATTGPKSSEQWIEVETGHYDSILDFEPTSKPKVVLPPITNGAANASAPQKLEERLEKAEAELKILKGGATQYEYAPQLRPDAQMQENLSTDVDTKLNELRHELQKQVQRDLSADQAENLLEHPLGQSK